MIFIQLANKPSYNDLNSSLWYYNKHHKYDKSLFVKSIATISSLLL